MSKIRNPLKTISLPIHNFIKKISSDSFCSDKKKLFSQYFNVSFFEYSASVAQW